MLDGQADIAHAETHTPERLEEAAGEFRDAEESADYPIRDGEGRDSAEQDANAFDADDHRASHYEEDFEHARTRVLD